MSSFAAGEHAWVERLGNLRNAVRQQLIGRQLERHVVAGATVLDVGCGQGTQLIRLARRGCPAIGIDPSPELLRRCAADAGSLGVAVELHRGDIDDLDALLGKRRFDVVCAHGLLMYLEDPAAALRRLCARLEPNGILSLTFRNGAALAFRAGVRRQWHAALEAFDADSYVNELGIDARSDRLENVSSQLAQLGMAVDAWYGVRVFTDPAPADAPRPDDEEFELLIRVEEQAGCRDPYRQLASQIHLIARSHGDPSRPRPHRRR